MAMDGDGEMDGEGDIEGATTAKESEYGMTGDPFDMLGGRGDSESRVAGTNSSRNASASEGETPAPAFPAISILFPTTTQQ